MEDLYFENELKRDIRERIMQKLKSDFNLYFSQIEHINIYIKEALQHFNEILDCYYARKLGKTEVSNEIVEMTDAFIENFGNKKIQEIYKNFQFSQEELEFIQLAIISKKWRNNDFLYDAHNYALIDICLRKTIIEQFGEESLEIFREIIQNEIPDTDSYKETRKHYLELFSDKPYGENVHAELESCIEEDVNHLFKFCSIISLC